MNAKIAKACVSGRLDKNPMVQGLLIQCLAKLEKEERGIQTLRGRVSVANETERRLLADAALSLAVAGGNRMLCEQLGQKVTPPRVRLEELPSLGLPNPALALMYPDQINENLKAIDARFPRAENTRARRLICGIDATYLLKTISQFSIKGQAGLVGGPWSPEDQSQAFISLSSVSASCQKAPLMMEFLCWNPCSIRNDTYSVAAMPMSLQAPRRETKSTLTHAGNWEA